MIVRRRLGLQKHDFILVVEGLLLGTQLILNDKWCGTHQSFECPYALPLLWVIGCCHKVRCSYLDFRAKVSRPWTFLQLTHWQRPVPIRDTVNYKAHSQTQKPWSWQSRQQPRICARPVLILVQKYTEGWVSYVPFRYYDSTKLS